MLLQELAELLAVNPFEAVVTPGQEVQRLREALLALLLEIARQQGGPLLIVLDDLQWADKSSCELLGYLVRRLVDYPVLLVGTVRENEMPSTHPLWALTANMQRERVINMLHIEALTDDQIAALVAHVPQPLARLIQNQVAGNPFFAEELARMCSDLEEIDDGGHKKRHKLTLPRTIPDVLDQRLQRLSSACQRFLQRAAVLGSSLSFDSLRLMESSDNSALDEDNIFTLIEEALHTKVLTEEQAGNSITYHFWHPLLMSHLYEQVSGVRRARLHRNAAEVFRQVYGAREEEGAAIITHHLVQGGTDAQQIAYYAELAGNHAYVLAAYPAAEHYYRLAIEQLTTSVKDISFAGARLHLALLWERLGECTRFQGNFQEALRCFERALELRCQHYPALSALPISNLQQEAQMRAMLCCQIGVSWYDRGDYVRARQCYSSVERLLKEAGIMEGPAWAYLLLQYSFLYWREGSYAEAKRVAGETLELFKAVLRDRREGVQFSHLTRLRRTLVGDPVDLGRTYSMLGMLAGTTGQLVETTAYFDTALQLFEQHDSQREIAITCCNLGDVHLHKADHHAAEQCLLRALEIAERIGETALLCFITGNLGLLALRTGKLAESEEWYRRGLKNAEQIDDLYSMCVLYSSLVFTLHEQGKSREVADCFRRAFSLNRGMGVPSCTAAIWAALGYVRLSSALAQHGPDIYLSQKGALAGPIETTRRFAAAGSAVQHTLSCSNVDIEVRTEAQFIMAHVSLLLGNEEEAWQQAMQMLESARQYEFTWLVARTTRLLACILVVRGRYQDAGLHFEQAMQLFRICGMDLEYARTLQLYGTMLLHREATDQASCQRGMNYLYEAHRLFEECHAALDLQVIERFF